jgi:hypothetical protein
VECDRSLAPIRGLELTAVLDAVWRTIASSKQLGKVVTGNDGCLIDLIIISWVEHQKTISQEKHMQQRVPVRPAQDP